MNPVTEQPPPPPRLSFRCDRHHEDNITGFCPSCLSERLTISSHRNFTSSSIPNATAEAPPDLRRTNEEEGEIRELISSSNSSDELEKDILEMEAKIDAIVDSLKSINQDISKNSSKFWWNWGRKKTSPKSKESEVTDYGFGPRFSLDGMEEGNLNSSSKRNKGLERSSSMASIGGVEKKSRWWNLKWQWGKNGELSNSKLSWMKKGKKGDGFLQGTLKSKIDV